MGKAPAPKGAEGHTRNPAAIAPLVVSDATAPNLLGMTPRAFRDAVRSQDIPHVQLGARVVVLVEDLRELAHAPKPPENVSGELPDDEDEGDLLEQLGRRRA